MLSEIDVQMLQHGHKQEYKIIKPSKELILVGKELEKLISETIRLQQIELKEAKSESENFLKNKFNINKVLQGSNDEVIAKLEKYDFKNIYQVRRIYKKMGKRIDPYKLPIELVDEDYRFGILEEIGLNCEDPKLLKTTPIIYEKIKLGKVITNCTPSILTHEITHSQIDQHKGATKSYYNHELIPIFLQLVHNLEKDSDQINLEIDKAFRLLEISEEIKRLNDYYQQEEKIPTAELLDLTKYLESALKAFSLFEIYLNSNNRVKSDILNQIQKIFNGKKTVEELLAKYNITLQNSSKFFQKQYLRKR